MSLKIYVACLASYNNGVLYGRHIDVDGKDADDIQAEIAAMLRGSRFPNVMVKHPETGEQVPSAEEWMIHDYDDDTGCGFSEHFGETSSIKPILELYEAWQEADDEDNGAAFAAWVRQRGRDDDCSYSRFQEQYRGTYDSFRDYADEQADEAIACHTPSLAEGYGYSKQAKSAAIEFFERYFDYEQFARDLEQDYTAVRLPDGNVAIFDDNA